MTRHMRSDSAEFPALGSTLGQMAGRHRLAAQAQATDLERGLRVAFGRMAQDLPTLDAKVLAVRVAQVSLAELADMLEPAMFVALLEGVGDRIGASLIAPALLAGLVEGAATGRVLSGPADTPRPPTRTDAALIAPLIDTLLQQIRDRCGTLLDGLMTGVWVYGSYLADPRPLPLMLEDGQFRLIQFTLSLGQDRVQGSWAIVLPEQAVPDARPGAVPASATAPPWAEQIEAAIHACPTDLSVTLFRAQLPLDAALSLAVGDMLCIPMAALETMHLETLDGQTLATGRLGQARGQRAMRLATDLGQVERETLAVPKTRSLTPLIRAAPSGQAGWPDPAPRLGDGRG